ncbi:unnamed protein product [Leuciscus chuanchicus]
MRDFQMKVVCFCKGCTVGVVDCGGWRGLQCLCVAEKREPLSLSNLPPCLLVIRLSPQAGSVVRAKALFLSAPGSALMESRSREGSGVRSRLGKPETYNISVSKCP